MDKFRAALSEAAATGDFRLPEGFLYLGGNPLLVRQWLETQAVANEQSASDFVLLALCIPLHGTRLAKDASSHAKFSKHGEGSQRLIRSASEVIKAYAHRMPVGGTLNSISSALPEIGLLAMLADSTKPAASCSQLNFREEVKLGLLQHTESEIGFPGASA